jgi:transposase
MPRNVVGLDFVKALTSTWKVIPMKKRAYRSTGVKKVKISDVRQELSEGSLWAGVDVGKEKLFLVLRDVRGKFSRPWKANQPGELGELVARVLELSQACPLVVALESTGTYGDALRQALTDVKVSVERVSGKATHDYAEIFDGVPSAHDGKDAAIIAELAALGKSTPWPYRAASEEDAELSRQVDWMDAQQDILQTWQGRLEALLSRHWPEATRILGLSSVTLLKVLSHYGGPAGLAQAGDAEEQLSRWGGRFLKSEKIRRFVQSAGRTVGVRMTEVDLCRMKSYAAEARQALREVETCKRALSRLASENETLARQAAVVGGPTACVLWVSVGDPADYPCGEAYRKAMGLNLKERSSGKYQGKLKITKRGPSLARRWLFFAAMRILQEPPVRGWFEGKKRKDSDRGLGAVVAVMRKLALALHAVGADGEEFSRERLFPGRPFRGRKSRSSRKPSKTRKD